MSSQPKLTELLSPEEQESFADIVTVTEKPGKRGKGVSRFFGGEKGKEFIPKRLADELMSMYSFKYAGQSLYVYKGGVYKPEGEQVAESEAQRLLGEKTKTSRIKEAVQYIERATWVELPEPNRRYINVLNGRFEWRTGELIPHDPNAFEIVQLPILYDPAARCPNFDRYIESTFDSAEERSLIEEIMGFSLVPDNRWEKAVLLTGTGANGKSVFLDILEALLGSDNVSNVDLQSLGENRFKAAELLGKLANIFADLDDRALTSSSAFKTLVSGDRITAERKNQHPFEFRSYAKLIFSANEPPPTRDKSFAFYRRLIIVPFMKTFDVNTADKELRTKLKKELNGIFNRALCGLTRLHERGAFTATDSSAGALEAYVLKNDSVRSFIDECATIEENSHVSKGAFYRSYCAWAREQGLRPVSQKKVKGALQKVVPNLDEWRSSNKTDAWHWIGVNLNSDAPSDNEKRTSEQYYY